VTRQHYDVAIVGAGSAGAVLASRLSEDPNRSVCLIEAGKDFTSIAELPPRVRGIDFTDRAYAAPRQPEHEWAYVARATQHKPKMAVPRGKIVGGSSSINGTVFLRALQHDLERWAAAANPDWSYANCLPYFAKLESDQDFHDEFHGQDGPIAVSHAAREDWLPLSEAFETACVSFGQPVCPDMNRPDARGVGAIPVNFRDSMRYSTAIGYLIPSRPRANLDVLCETRATGLRVAKRHVESISVVSKDVPLEVTADEYILSAGAIGSPHLLLLSGIGPADQVASIGITPVLDLPGVGQHVLDHPYVMTFWDTFDANAIETFPPPGVPWQAQLRTTAPGSELADDGWLTLIMSTPRDGDGGRGFMIPSSLMYEKSLGELCITSADPAVPPVIDFNYFSDSSDFTRLRALAQLALSIGEHRAFDGLRAGLRRPSSEDRASDAAFDAWIMRTVNTGHHISCTCRVGPASDPSAVVDQSGRVHGVDNLRVIDASIMPDCPGVNLNNTVIMMAEKLADTIG
jgi:choline dehydrogenase